MSVQAVRAVDDHGVSDRERRLSGHSLRTALVDRDRQFAREQTAAPLSPAPSETTTPTFMGKETN